MPGNVCLAVLDLPSLLPVIRKLIAEMKLTNLLTNCQMSSWLSAVLEILHCDHVHVVCQTMVMVT